MPRCLRHTFAVRRQYPLAIEMRGGVRFRDRLQHYNVFRGHVFEQVSFCVARPSAAAEGAVRRGHFHCVVFGKRF